MGGQRHYIPSGGFSEYLYERVGDVEYIDGLRCSKVRMINDPNNHAGLPKYSDTSDIYVGLGTDNKPIQLRIYKNRDSWMDFDWAHTHTNKIANNEVFPKGMVHVQRYPGATAGDARLLTPSEIALYGDIIHHYAPWVKFR